MYDFIYSIVQFWSSVINSFSVAIDDTFYNNNPLLYPLFKIDFSPFGNGSSYILVVDFLTAVLSIATFALLIWFSFKIIKYLFRYIGNIFGGLL